MVFTAPELVETEVVEMGGELDVALELERRVLADRMVWRQEGSEFEAGRSAPRKTACRCHEQRVRLRLGRLVSERSRWAGG
jgi:hypothetical protein